MFKLLCHDLLGAKVASKSTVPAYQVLGFNCLKDCLIYIGLILEDIFADAESGCVVLEATIVTCI